ncbi:TetR/AcrR family transcriptional regulator [Planococcus donghaensis]|uniref:TetR family transcriptional regulator n=1 Tax=Planococcus donghaensis TaxID=414778 RepID=A0A1C7EE58_9BACL|nr:TetR/AcrR family transcriptional regulator [Planococcus donghaensis]ANU22150.1 TetR family transcriptional regulator [Planococcus donghaensis]
MARATRKIEILHAASKVVSERGIFNLTLEAVAIEAGVSKGGLLYHFPSKEALVKGMVEHLAGNYREKISASVEESTQEHGKWISAYADVTFNNTYPNKEMHAGLLAAKAVNSDLLDPIRDLYNEWQAAIEDDGIDPVKATIIRLAADGIWLSELFDIHHLDEHKKKEIYIKMKKWINE